MSPDFNSHPVEAYARQDPGYYPDVASRGGCIRVARFDDPEGSSAEQVQKATQATLISGNIAVDAVLKCPGCPAKWTFTTDETGTKTVAKPDRECGLLYAAMHRKI